jgi:hypothetical protein
MDTLNNLEHCIPKCNMYDTSGTWKDFKGYAAENKLLKIVPEFCCQMNSNIKKIKQICFTDKAFKFLYIFYLTHSFFVSSYLKLNHSVVWLLVS